MWRPLQGGYVIAKPIGGEGLYCELYGATPESLTTQPYLRDFIDKVRAANLAFGSSN